MRYSLSATRNYRGGIYVPPESIFGTIRPTKKPTVRVGGVDVLLFAKCIIGLPPPPKANCFRRGVVLF